MIKAVCFDFFNTLAYFYPLREATYAGIAAELGIQVTAEAIAESLPQADAFWRAENLRSPIKEREQQDKFAVYSEYGLRILQGAGVQATPEQGLQMLAKAFAIGFVFKAYEDSLPILKEVKRRSLKIGLISNIGQEINDYCVDLGFEPFLDFKVTSWEVGYDKPRPEIFRMALTRADVQADETIFVGDQYEQDVLGARGVGMLAILIDRNQSGKSFDCAVIHDLARVIDYI
ncbi:MAG: HAD family hydrolase [Chloroflexi bacterium]|nr:HAD family hydrolase [Chloroflexota bacterium]